jgi:hypothetical protein
MQWLQNPNQSNVDNLNTVRREASRHFRNKKKEYLKAKINELEQCGFTRNRSTTDHIFYIRQILEKNGNTMGQCISYL